MPVGEKFWNPYRWIEVSDQPIDHAPPLYHHRFDGLSGRIECALTALTPLIIGDGHGNFVTHRATGRPYIPATSLKGTIRSLAEIVGNAAVPFPTSKIDVDESHRLENGVKISKDAYRLDCCARLFGFILPKDKKAGRGEDRQFVGLIQFSDAEPVGQANPNQWPQHTVAVGQPKPSHKPFYHDNKRRKAYHHTPGAQHLTGPHAGITQTTQNRCAPPGTSFRFTVDFRNLREEELNLLLYCLALEDNVTVTLGKDALGPDTSGPVTITGPMRHKVGGCKPHGGGSSHIQITRLIIRTDPAARYRGQASAQVFEHDNLADELSRRTAQFVQRTDKTTRQLRAMMIYSPDDPRRPVNYPTYQWFQEDKQLPHDQKRRLKSTL